MFVEGAGKCDFLRDIAETGGDNRHDGVVDAAQPSSREVPRTQQPGFTRIVQMATSALAVEPTAVSANTANCSETK